MSKDTDGTVHIKAPFPWFGGKRRAAPLVWQRFGDVKNYVEPFMGSCAVLLGRPHYPFTENRIETINDLDCVVPETRILTSDLLWVEAEKINLGQELLSFDEFNSNTPSSFKAPSHYRRWKKTKVVAVRRIKKPCYKLTFDDGTVVTCSNDHMWLAGSHCNGSKGGRSWRWIKTENMCVRSNQRSWVFKVTDVSMQDNSFESGYLSGIIDGEGSLKCGTGLKISIAQKNKDVLEQIIKLLNHFKIDFSLTPTKRDVFSIQIRGGIREQLKVLMKLRPIRLINKLKDRINELSLYGREHQAIGLVSKEFVGIKEVVAIQTDSHTFIAEGLASHNCYLANIWRCIKYDPDQTAEYADNWVCEADLHARHRWCYDNHEFRHRMRTEPEYYDCKVGGYWLFGISSWIGDNWCRVKGIGMSGVTPHLTDSGKGINRALPPAGCTPHLTSSGQGINRALPPAEDDGIRAREQDAVPHLGSSGKGINRALPPADGGKGLIPTDIKEAENYVGCTPHLTNSGKGINRALPPADHLQQKIPHLGDSGRGVNRALPPADHLQQKIPNLGNQGEGIHKALPPANLKQQLPNLGHNNGVGCNRTQDISPTRCRTKDERLADLKQYMRKLQDRLRFVRVCNGDWMRVCSPTVTYRHGLTGLFLDPPYSLEKNKQTKVYGNLSEQTNLNADITKFLLENQDIDGFRIAVCGYEGEYDLPKKYWDCIPWMGNSGYANKTVNKNREKERIWFNKQCIDPDKRPVGRPRKIKVDERSMFKPEDY